MDYKSEKSLKTSLVYGRKPVLDLIDSGRTIEKIMLKKGTKGAFEIELRNKLKGKDIPVQHIPEEKLNRFYSGNHQGVIAICSLIEYQEIDQILPLIFESGKSPNVLVLDGITDVRNFGAIARSAEIFGVHAIIIPIKGAAQINEVAIKSSAGALLNIPVCRVKSLMNTIEYLKSSGLKIFGASQSSKTTLGKADLQGPLALVMGSEGEGLSPHIQRSIDEGVAIPQVGKTESLNVSVATGIFLYETMKQRH